MADGFYQGKKITIIVGARPGVAYDLYARLAAKYMQKYLAGTPSIAVENARGAGARTVANRVYQAKPDGLTLGAISPELYFSQLLDPKEIAFDWSRFSWIGTLDRSSHLLYMRADTGCKTIHDIGRASKPFRCGVTGEGRSTSYLLPKFLEEILGAKFTMVTGFQEGPDIDTAVERGELECRVLTISGFFSHEPYHTWRKTSFVRMLLQTGRERDAKIPDVSTLYEVMDEERASQQAKTLAEVILSTASFGRPIVGPPGLPAETREALRQALIKAANDPELLKNAQAQNLGVTLGSGAELQRLAGEVVSPSGEVIEHLRRLAAR